MAWPGEGINMGLAEWHTSLCPHKYMCLHMPEYLCMFMYEMGLCEYMGIHVSVCAYMSASHPLHVGARESREFPVAHVSLPSASGPWRRRARLRQLLGAALCCDVRH